MMEVALITIAILIFIAFGIHAVRFFKLRKLQIKRNNCDLTTKQGRYAANQYNKRINQLMNFDNTTGNNSSDNG